MQNNLAFLGIFDIFICSTYTRLMLHAVCSHVGHILAFLRCDSRRTAEESQKSVYASTSSGRGGQITFSVEIRVGSNTVHGKVLTI